jgi:Rab-like protein 2
MSSEQDASSIPELDQDKYDSDEQVKIICLGDSAVGKAK